MLNRELKKRQIKKCLNCKIGTEVISDYGYIYDLKQKENLTGKFSPEDDESEIINNLSNSLNLNGTIKEKYKLLKKLSENSCFSNDEPNICLENLQHIISSIYDIYDTEETDLTSKSSLFYYILEIMNEINKSNKQESKKGERAFKYKNSKKKLEDEDTYKKIICDGLHDIMEKYSPSHKQTYEINHQGECFGKLFSEDVQKHYLGVKAKDKANFDKKEVFQRINNLCDKAQKIILCFIRNAPKRFGYNLQMVMDTQHMTEQDISVLTGIGVSAIQSWEIADTPQKNPKNITLLCRALLVSEDVLFKGQGKIYGNWKELFEGDTFKEIQNAISDSKKKKSGKNEAKTFIRNNIKKCINLGNEEFQYLISSTPDLFCEKDFSIFANEEACYEYLIHKEEVHILLEILEETEL